MKQFGVEIKALNEDEVAIIVFDDSFGTSNCEIIDQFLIRGIHNILDSFVHHNPNLINQKEQYEKK